MAMDRFIIAPFTTGLETYLKPWLIPDDAWSLLQNAYIFRGRVRKRVGGILMGRGTQPSAVTAPLASRLRINIGTTDGAGNIAGIVPGNVFAVGQAFSIGIEIFTVTVAGVPGVMLTTGASAVHTYNTTTGAFVINGATALTSVYFYPATPVMGLTIYEDVLDAFNNRPSYAFDTQFAYKFFPAGWERSGAAIWHGSNLNLFWATNWTGVTDDIKVLFVTNFNFTSPVPGANDDPIWWTTNGTVWTAGTGANAFYFMPNGGAPHTGPYVKTARILIAFEDRLVLLNTVENDNSGGAGVNAQFRNRARWSHRGDVFAQNAWYEPQQQDNSGGANDTGDGAGFADATTDEEIMSAAFIKNRLIVYFDSSTWELVFLNNSNDPFRWQRINSTLGSQGTFSSVPFDKVILTMSGIGVHACNGANVERIDDKIPDTVFNIRQEVQGIERTEGIRDYFNEVVYWTFPAIDAGTFGVFPNQVLVYNYRTGSWALNDDAITAFGYFEQQQPVTWANAHRRWEEAHVQWGSSSQQGNFEEILAGNQQGFVFIIQEASNRNAPVLQISKIVNIAGGMSLLTIINHTLPIFGSYIAIENAQGGVFNPADDGIYKATIIDINTVRIPATFVGTYTGGGTATRISNIQMESKQWNPYVQKSRNVYVAKIDFSVETTVAGEITVDYYASSSRGLSLVGAGKATGALVGTNVLETFPYNSVINNGLESSQERVWHPIYFQSDGECIQILMSFKDDPNLAVSEIRRKAVVWDSFVLHGMVLHTMPTTDRLY